jgi:hypothetical protein
MDVHILVRFPSSGKPEVDEVLVDARTGALVSVEHDSVADERK